jgi:UDP-N-acetylglucosamine 2-epimerase
VNIIAGAKKENILHAFDSFKNAAFPASINLYGDGTASGKIADRINKGVSKP